MYIYIYISNIQIYRTPPRRNYRREAVRRPTEVHLVAPSRFGAQTQSARLTFSPFWAPTPPSEKFPRRGLKWSRGSWAVSRLYLEGTLRVTRRSPEGLYIAQRWSTRGIYNTHTIYIVTRRHGEGPETVARGSLYHPKMVPTGSLEHTHIHIYIQIRSPGMSPDCISRELRGFPQGVLKMVSGL